MMPPDRQLAFDEVQDGASRVALDPCAIVLRGFARPRARDLIAAIETVTAISPFRHMVTPGGWEMSVAMTNCCRTGRLGHRPHGLSL
jgi:alkylated DNA repair protein (DNA oxidative demethylase)